MPGKRSAEAQKRRSEKGARHVYAALQRRETTVAIREVAARRREEMAPQINHTSLVVAQAAVAEMQQAVRLQAHQLDPGYVNRGMRMGVGLEANLQANLIYILDGSWKRTEHVQWHYSCIDCMWRECRGA